MDITRDVQNLVDFCERRGLTSVKFISELPKNSYDVMLCNEKEYTIEYNSSGYLYGEEEIWKLEISSKLNSDSISIEYTTEQEMSSFLYKFRERLSNLGSRDVDRNTKRERKMY